jgi:hypothetical protein
VYMWKCNCCIFWQFLLIFWKITTLFSTVAVSLYIPTNSVFGLQFMFIPTDSYHSLLLVFIIVTVQMAVSSTTSSLCLPVLYTKVLDSRSPAITVA